MTDRNNLPSVEALATLGALVYSQTSGSLEIRASTAVDIAAMLFAKAIVLIEEVYSNGYRKT